MKKLAAIISAVLTTIIICTMPFMGVSAEESNNYYTFVQFRSNYDLNSNNYEFLFKYDAGNNYYNTCGCSISRDKFSSVVSDCHMSNGIFYFEAVNHVDFYVSQKNSQYDVFSNPKNTSWTKRVKKFTFNTSTNQMNVYDENNNLYSGSAFYSSPFTVDEYTCNFDEFITEPITVELFPDLCENFDYKGEYDGFSMELTQLQVDITNNTGYNYEYAILVQPKNSDMNVGLPNNSENNTFFWGSSPVTYALVKDEWIQRDAADAISAAFNAIGYNPYVGDVSAPITINTPSAWHYLPHNDTKREWIYYEQMQLKRGVDYTFKVYVYNITQNAPQNYSDDLVYPAYNNIELVYSKEFSVVKDTKFDADSVSNGAYSFDNTATLGSQFDKIKGYQEQDGNIKIFDNSNSSASGASGRVGSNSSYNNLISNSSSFLSLCKNVFNYLPDYVSMLLFGGLLCMVLVAIWRKL